MLHKAWNSRGEMPYCFPRSSIKFQGHTGQNITDFDPNWTFLDYRPVSFQIPQICLVSYQESLDWHPLTADVEVWRGYNWVPSQHQARIMTNLGTACKSAYFMGKRVIYSYLRAICRKAQLNLGNQPNYQITCEQFLSAAPITSNAWEGL